MELLPKGTYEAVNIKEYGQLIREKYAQLIPYPRGKFRAVDPADVIKDNHRCDIRRIVEQGQDTFCASVFLPCHHALNKSENASGHSVEIVVAHPQMDNIDFLVIADIPKLPEYKHLGLRQMKVHFKKVKKVKLVRNFHRPSSVFHDWRADTRKNMDKAFEIDSQFIKADKFIKDKEDVEATLEVLREYFQPLKN